MERESGKESGKGSGQVPEQVPEQYTKVKITHKRKPICGDIMSSRSGTKSTIRLSSEFDTIIDIPFVPEKSPK